MGSPNFCHDNFLLTTYGLENEDCKKMYAKSIGIPLKDIDEDEADEAANRDLSLLRQQVDEALESVDSNFFELKTDNGYYEGFVISAYTQNCTCLYIESNFDYANNFVADVIDDCIKSKRVWAEFRKKLAENAMDEAQFYVENLLAFALEDLETYDSGVQHEHYAPLVDRLKERNIDFAVEDDALIDIIAQAADKQVLIEMLQKAIDDDLKNIDEQLQQIAKQNSLKQLVGVNWTPQLVEI